MDLHDFIKGKFELTITCDSNQVDFICPYDANHLFFSVVNSLMAGNDVHIYFDKNPYHVFEHESCSIDSVDSHFIINNE